jgi:hypothetical protein
MLFQRLGIKNENYHILKRPLFKEPELEGNISYKLLGSLLNKKEMMLFFISKEGEFIFLDKIYKIGDDKVEIVEQINTSDNFYVLAFY